jgi:mannitol/fructose-specific phosphotransferase system IIA component (Ntr-type)
MISIADTLRPERIRLALTATSSTAAIRETAGLLQNVTEVLDWAALSADVLRSAPCLSEQGSDFAICLPHARTDAVKTMVMSIGRSVEGIAFPDCAEPVRYIFCIGVPKALASDYLRIVGLLARILKDPRAEAELRAVSTPAAFLDWLTALEARL